MSYTELQSRYVVGRDWHRCSWCDGRIEKGEKQRYRAYVFQGEFTTDRMHLDCEVAMKKSSRESLEDGWMPGEFKRGEVA